MSNRYNYRQIQINFKQDFISVAYQICIDFNIDQVNIGQAQINNQNICLKINIAQWYFVLGRAELRWNYSCWLRDASDIHRFPAMHTSETHFLLRKIWEHQNHTWIYWENSKIAWISLI